MTLDDPIGSLNMVGPTYAKRLEKLGILTIENLLYHLPSRYDDFSLISPIAKVQPGETVTITAKIDSIKNEFTKNNKKIQKAEISDATGQLEIIWFNQPFLIQTLKMGETYNFSGKCDWFGRQKVLVSPEYEIINSLSPNTNQLSTIHTGRLVPIYPETYGVSSKWLRSRIKVALNLFLNQVIEFLPKDVLIQENLFSEQEALRQIHFPDSTAFAQKAKYRLAFDELFLLQLSGLIRKKDWQLKSKRKKYSIDLSKIAKFIQKLPFDLTKSQEQCLTEIFEDMTTKDVAMNRLLEGDVGSGKTVVAALAGYAAYLNSESTLVMAPTEILANQHYLTLKSLLEPFGVPIDLITGSRKEISNVQDRASYSKIIVGTHALLFQDFSKENIGLVVADEQHRFGVDQRSVLLNKGVCPHFLSMTATPIPRTISLTLFGDLSLSVINEMPKGRIPVKTWVVPNKKRDSGYHWIKERIKDTPEQAFIICPLIDQSESLVDVKAVTQEFETLSKKIFPDLKLSLLHGRIKPKEKEKILSDFKEGKSDILVSTPVVEVGIDIPNATIMVIEGADRFGLAQLHQLRGRVGRGDRQSYCFLFSENNSEKVIQRLKSLETINSGLELAEVDLKHRGPGEIYGTKQHGFPDLSAASFTDLDLIKKTRVWAEKIGQNIVLTSSSFSPLKKKLEKYKINAVSN